jgi:hypothetical protein
MSEHPEHQSKQERMREALEKIAKDTVSLPCDDPQCGDSTWDHECTLGRRAPSELAKIAIAALSDVTEQKQILSDKPEPLGQTERGTNINPLGD